MRTFPEFLNLPQITTIPPEMPEPPTFPPPVPTFLETCAFGLKVLAIIYSTKLVVDALAGGDRGAMVSRPRPRWLVREKAFCAELGMGHVGGSGAPDCVSPGAIADHKDWTNPVTAYDVAELAKKPWAQGMRKILGTTGRFTDRAKTQARSLGVELKACKITHERRRRARMTCRKVQ